MNGTTLGLLALGVLAGGLAGLGWVRWLEVSLWVWTLWPGEAAVAGLALLAAGAVWRPAWPTDLTRAALGAAAVVLGGGWLGWVT